MLADRCQPGWAVCGRQQGLRLCCPLCRQSWLVTLEACLGLGCDHSRLVARLASAAARWLGAAAVVGQQHRLLKELQAPQKGQSEGASAGLSEFACRQSAACSQLTGGLDTLT